jgi:glycosyltransferase involved in cell wall biosynthesis
MRQARLFVLSSFRPAGSVGQVIAEAMVCGCPAFSTDYPNGPAEILQGGNIGRLGPVGDVGAMARAIEESLGPPAEPERLVIRARDFGRERIAGMYLKVPGLDLAS